MSTPDELYAVADVLDDGCDRLDEVGWAQGPDFLGVSLHSTCAMNALTDVAGEVAAAGAAPILAAHLGITAPIAVLGIIEWNDADGRTEAEVLDALRSCAKSQRWEADRLTVEAAFPTDSRSGATAIPPDPNAAAGPDP